uniref:Reverse transcriptase domain-containing protein n=1 Tax=Ananas comosus var. bracteatus TaxID=296719 RepID=A0A6V7PH31_ANACO|nr:unnamed protein product [Ananas comosus var. bracteatus]
MIFYQRFWNLIKVDILEVFNCFYSGATNLQDINTGWVCLLPKRTEAVFATDYRPISLVHSLSKLISKVLATRLQAFMDKLINPFQAAFIKGRSILDNFNSAHILIHHLHSSKERAALLKIDFERAFDHINWQFLLALLKARGFDNRWLGWIEALLHSANTAVLLNGIPGKAFTCKRGLRQGDPLSPLLFILCVDVFFRMIHLAVTSLSITAVGIGNVKLHTLQFADDILLFFDGSARSAAAIKIILDTFSSNSGLRINYYKSYLTPINLPNDQAATVANSFGCSLKDFPLTYLDLPLSPKKLRRSDYMPLIEKIDNRLSGWKSLVLSRGGRLVLLNSPDPEQRACRGPMALRPSCSRRRPRQRRRRKTARAARDGIVAAALLLPAPAKATEEEDDGDDESSVGFDECCQMERLDTSR